MIWVTWLLGYAEFKRIVWEWRFAAVLVGASRHDSTSLESAIIDGVIVDRPKPKPVLESLQNFCLDSVCLGYIYLN